MIRVKTIGGGDGNNIIDVGGGDDDVIAGAGDDVIRLTVIAAGEQGDDIQAGDGDDRIFISGVAGAGAPPATTLVSCGAGADTVRATGMSASFRGTFAGPVTIPDTAGNSYVFDADCETIIVR